MSAARRRLIIWGLRIAVSAAVLAVVFHIVPVSTVVDAAKRLPLWLWLAGFAFFLAGHALSAAKWWMLIGSDVPFHVAFRAHLAGLGANLALPGVAGGDVVRAALVVPHTSNGGRLAIGSLADRLVDTASLGLVALAGAWFAFQSDAQTAIEVIAALIGALIASVIFLRLFSAPIARMAMRLAGEGKIGRLLGKIGTTLADLGRQPGLLAACLGLSLVTQCLFVAINIAFANAMGLNVPAAAWFYAWASAKIIAIAPISLGGLGVREASMAALLKPFGADYGAVIAVGLIWQTVLYASGILGIIVQSTLSAVPRRGAPSTNDPQPNAGQI